LAKLQIQKDIGQKKVLKQKLPAQYWLVEDVQKSYRGKKKGETPTSGRVSGEGGGSLEKERPVRRERTLLIKVEKKKIRQNMKGGLILGEN